MVEWRDVVGYEGRYLVSSDGQVQSLLTGCILSQSLIGSGYLRVSLWKDGKQRVGKVHLLVAAAFHGERPPGVECLHDDGNKLNNKSDNLLWGTSKENQGDRRRHGTDPSGERNGRAKLSAEKVAQIRHELSTGASARSLGRRFGVSRTQILRIRNGQAWRATSRIANIQ